MEDEHDMEMAAESADITPAEWAEWAAGDGETPDLTGYAEPWLADDEAA